MLKWQFLLYNPWALVLWELGSIGASPTRWGLLLVGVEFHRVIPSRGCDPQSPCLGQHTPHCGMLERTILTVGLLGQHTPHCGAMGQLPLAVGFWAARFSPQQLSLSRHAASAAYRGFRCSRQAL